MEFINFPIVALGAALVCLIGVTIYALTQRGSLRSRDEQLVVARAQAYAMLELSQAGVLFLDREHKLMGEASAAAPELLGHTCGAGTAFVQVIADLVDVSVRRETVAFLETMWKAEASAQVDATQNPLARVHSGTRHLALRFSRLVVDGRVHHIIVSIERIAAPRVMPHTIEVPALNEDTFAKRLAGETGTRPALKIESVEPCPRHSRRDRSNNAAAATRRPCRRRAELPPMLTGEFELGPLDVTADSVPSVPHLGNPAVATMAALAQLKLDAAAANSELSQKTATLAASMPTNAPVADADTRTLRRLDEREGHLATTITSPDVVNEAAKPATPPEPDPSGIIDPPDPRLNEVLKEVMNIEAARLETLPGRSAREGRSAARHHQAARARAAGVPRKAGADPRADPRHQRARPAPAVAVGVRTRRALRSRARRPARQTNLVRQRFPAAGGQARRPAEPSRHPGRGDHPPARVARAERPHVVFQHRRHAAFGHGHGHHHSPAADCAAPTRRRPRFRSPAPPRRRPRGSPIFRRKASRKWPPSSPTCIPSASRWWSSDSRMCRASYRRAIEKILGQLIHNAIRHGLETPADRVVQDKPEIGTVAVQFVRAGADGYQLSVQDDGRGLDHDKIRAEAVRQGVLTPEVAANIDPRKLASLIFRPGFTTVSEGARGIGMDVVRDLVSKAGGKVGIATKPGEYTRFRISLPHEKKASDAAVA